MMHLRDGIFDEASVSVISADTVREIGRVAGRGPDVRRFRPNLVVTTQSAEPFPEQAWIGRKLRIGEAQLSIAMECPRCVMTTHGFADLPEDLGIMRKLVKEAGGNLGVYARVEQAGEVRTGDPIQLLD